MAEASNGLRRSYRIGMLCLRLFVFAVHGGVASKQAVEGLQAQRASAGHGPPNIRRRCARRWLPRCGWLARVAAASSSFPCGQPALPRHQQGLARTRSRKKRIETSRVLPTLFRRFLHALNHARTSSRNDFLLL